MRDDEELRARASAAARRLGMVDPTIERLEGGSRNHVYRGSSSGNSVVVRIAGEHDAELRVERASELAILRLAARTQLAPEILLEAEGGALLVMRDAGSGGWTAAYARSDEAIRRVAAWMARLHRVDVPPGLREVDFSGSLREYRGRLRGIVPERILRRAAAVRDALAEAGAAVLCHNDLHHSNLLDSAGELLAIDWEYAGVGSPVMDLAGYAAYHDLDARGSELLLETYAERGLAFEPRLLEAGRWLFEAVWLAWLELRQRLDPGIDADVTAARRRLVGRVGRPAAGWRTPR